MGTQSAGFHFPLKGCGLTCVRVSSRREVLDPWRGPNAGTAWRINENDAPQIAASANNRIVSAMLIGTASSAASPLQAILNDRDGFR